MSLFGNIFDKDLNINDSKFQDEPYIKRIFNFLESRSSPRSPRRNEKDTTDGKNSPTTTRKVSINEKAKRFDLSPKNQDVVDYCHSLINVHFHGQVDTEENDSSSLIPPTVVKDGEMSLAEAMIGMDELLRSVGDDFSGDEEEFQFFLQACVEARDPDKGNDRWFRRKFNLDAKNFVQIYKRRNNISEELTHNDYWATRQQLLSAKVVADWIDPDYGSIDPVFGVLLNPTLGRTGPGDSGWVHKMLFDDDGPMAYHSAVHDAFGYLITNHDMGPGYDYLGAWSLFESHTCMSGQLSGIKFWKDVLKKEVNVKPQRL